MTHYYWRRFIIIISFLFSSLFTWAQTPGTEGLVPDATELSVLRDLYTTTGGPSWNNRTNWLTGTTLAEAATWYGVTVSGGDVVGLRLTYQNMQGPAPAFLSQLTALQTLDFNHNTGLTGPLPLSWTTFPALTTLNVWATTMRGAVPPQLGQLPQLQVLNLRGAGFTGPLPPELGSLANLTTLELSRNGLTGPIPKEWGQLRRLQSLQLSYTQVTGPLPAELGQMSELRDLTIYNSRLTGPIPPELGNLSKLQVLTLGNYYTTPPGQGNRMTGALPKELGNLASLTYMEISLNPFGGTLPKEFGKLTNLTFLELDGCGLTGEVPAELLQLTRLNSLYLGFNSPFPVEANNQFTSIPNLSAYPNRGSLSLWLGKNQLEFGSLEPLYTGPGQVPFPRFEVLPQTLSTEDIQVNATEGESLTLPSAIGGTRTRYQWQKEQPAGTWTDVAGATSASFQLAQVSLLDQGRYRCQATNEWVTGLTLYSRPQRVEVEAEEQEVLPPSDPSADLDRNWVMERTFDLEDKVTSESKQFADAMGRPTQSQVKNLSRKHVFASQTVYDAGGKGGLTTLAAPIQNQDFNYKEGFITSGGADYGYANFEYGKKNNPDAVDVMSGTLGHYYSGENTLEPYTAATKYPFTLTESYEGPLGGSKRATGPGDEFRMGLGREVKGRQMPLLNELTHYLSLRRHFVPTAAGVSLLGQGSKLVSIDANGIESIAFTDKEGLTLATCLSGSQYPGVTLSGSIGLSVIGDAAQVSYQDIHIPSAGPTSFTFDGGGKVSIINLLTETKSALLTDAGVVTGTRTITLEPGFYRLVAESTGYMNFSYLARYGDFSYAYYDDAGRPVASVAPNGVNLSSADYPSFVTRNVYSGAGTLVSTESIDEGKTEYVYARDGRLRFSQSARQRQENKFSYSNYDRAGRVVESGEYEAAAGNLVFQNELTETPAANSVLQPAVLEDRTPAGGLNPAGCRQRNYVLYDLPADDLPSTGRTQEFVLGAVARTSNGTSTTWYSYDELGQATWLVQQVPGLGVKTVDYTYDKAGNVLEVAYQKGQPDAFYHHYQYDASQRLTRVYTSPDGLTKTQQARYTYYLHGPLERTLLGNKLQGIDYVYTVQGWLKSINHATKSLDPGIDTPTRNGIYKDLFGLTLDYFSGDYRSGKLAAVSPAIPNAAPTRYDGTVRSAAWQTPASPEMRMHAYRYDAKGQLLQADYGALRTDAFTPAPNNALEEGALQYDANGNLQRLRRRDLAGFATDDFSYKYTASTNKLSAVHNQAGAAVLDFDYDATGQMTRQRDEKGQTYLAYDVTGKVTGVYRDAQHQQPLATFAYDDRGFRTSKASYDPATFQLKQTTTYVTDAQGTVLSIYEQAVGKPLERTEVPLYGSGRVGTLTRLDDGTLDTRYELNDQLGNARVIFHKPKTVTYQATMELSQATREEQDFQNLAATRTSYANAYSGQYVATLYPQGAFIGPTIAIPVVKGDTVSFSAMALLSSNVTTQTARVSPSLLLAAAATPTATSGRREESRKTSRLNTLLSHVTVGLIFKRRSATRTQTATAQQQTGTVSAFLTYFIEDEEGEADGGVDSYVPATAVERWEKVEGGVRVQHTGTLYVSSRSNDANYAVHFDDFIVKHTGSTIVQEQHTYAYGAPLTGLNYVVGGKRYRHGYQGQYAEQDAETGYESFELRMYSSRLGRWSSYDPYGQYASPYVGMGNNPVSGTDPDGGWQGGGAAVVATAANPGYMLNGVSVIGSRLAQAIAPIAARAVSVGVSAWTSLGNSYTSLQKLDAPVTKMLMFNSVFDRSMSGLTTGNDVMTGKPMSSLEIGLELAGAIPGGRVSKYIPPEGVRLFKAALAPYNKLLTEAGRAVTKHPTYFGFANGVDLMRAYRTPKALNDLGSKSVKEILRYGKKTSGAGGRYPDGWTTYTLPDGRAASWNADGTFIGFRGLK